MFESKDKISGIEAAVGFSILPYLNTRQKTIVGLPIDKEDTYDKRITLSPYSSFLKNLENYELAVFFFDPDYMYPVLTSSFKKLIIVSPYVLNLKDVSWFRHRTTYPTTIIYTEKPLREISMQGKVLVVIPKYAQLAKILELLPNSQSYTYGEEITSDVLVVTSQQASLAAWFFLPDMVIDMCQRELILETTMSGYYQTEVYTSQMDANAIARLSSLDKSGICYRLIQEKTFNSLPLVYNWPEYYPDEFPLGLKNIQVLNLWIAKGYPPFSLLCPLVMLDNFSPLLFVYPAPTVYHASYLYVAQQQYKTFFARFSGKDSLETLSKIWEIFLQEVGTFNPSYSETRKWCEDNSLSVKHMWNYLQQIQVCVNMLGKLNIETKKGPSSSKEIRELAAPLFSQVYPERKMVSDRQGFSLEGKIYYIQYMLLPSSLGIDDKEILGLILKKDGVIAGISL